MIFIAGWGLLYRFGGNTYKSKIIFLLISLIPLCSFLSSEIYLIFNQREIQFLSSGKIYRILIMLLVSIAVIFFFKKFKVHVRYTAIFLWLIIGITCFAFYKPFIEQPTDMFELANPANGIMRLFQFHEWPIFQALGSHMLSEQVFGYLYCLLNGYDGTCSFLIYNFFTMF